MDLDYLSLAGAKVTDDAPLKECQLSDFVNLSGNSITDLTPLMRCKITGRLGLRGNPVKEIKALAGQDFSSRDLSKTQVANIRVTSLMKKLRKINIKGRNLDDESEELLLSWPTYI